MPGGYGRIAIGFHWVTALLVVAVGILGVLHDSWPRSTQAFWINIHALVGLAVWLLVMARFVWRTTHPPPDLPPEVGEFSRRVSYSAHLLLYGLLFIIPIFGIVTFIWHGRVFNFGLFRIDLGVARDRAIFHPTENIHGYLAYTLFSLVGLHVLGALWHHFVRHDSVLQRMWPAARRERG